MQSSHRWPLWLGFSELAIDKHSWTNFVWLDQHPLCRIKGAYGALASYGVVYGVLRSHSVVRDARPSRGVVHGVVHGAKWNGKTRRKKNRQNSLSNSSHSHLKTRRWMNDSYFQTKRLPFHEISISVCFSPHLVCTSISFSLRPVTLLFILVTFFFSQFLPENKNYLSNVGVM